MVLQTNLKQVVLIKLKQLNASHDLIFIEKLKEKDEKCFDYEKAWIKVNKGYSLYDAYVLENLESIKIDNLNAGKANVINSVNSKGHIKTTSGGTSQQVSVPSDILAMYKKNMPKWTEQQIIEHYNKTLGGND